MDTDQLTRMAYECIGLAADASDFLRSEIGAACSGYRSEDAYLRGMLAFVERIASDPEGYLDEWELVEDDDVSGFVPKLRILREHIEQTLATPLPERGEPNF